MDVTLYEVPFVLKEGGLYLAPDFTQAEAFFENPKKGAVLVELRPRGPVPMAFWMEDHTVVSYINHRNTFFEAYARVFTKGKRPARHINLSVHPNGMELWEQLFEAHIGPLADLDPILLRRYPLENVT